MSATQVPPTSKETFQRVCDSLRFFEEPITLAGFVSKYNYLKSRFQASPDSNLRKMVFDWRGYIPITDETAKAVRQGSLSPDLLEPALFYLRQAAFSGGRLEEALAYQEQLQAAFPGSSFLQEPTQMVNMARITKFRLDSLAQQTLRPDERLWALGNIWATYAESGLFVNEYSGYDYGLAQPYFETLLEKYPDSPLADNAAFKLSEFSLSGAGEGGDLSYCFEAALNYKKLLDKYPKSDLRATYMLEIAQLFLDFDDGDSDHPEGIAKIMNSCKLGINITNQRLKEFPNLPEGKGSEEMLRLLHQKITLYSLKLNITFDKNYYRKDEPVFFTFTITNPTEEAIEFEVPFHEICPNFDLRIICDTTDCPEDQREMYTGASFQYCNRTGLRIHLKAGGIYQERWDVTSQVFRKISSHGNLFPAPGHYSISSRFQLQEPFYRSIWSEDIKIQIGP